MVDNVTHSIVIVLVVIYVILIGGSETESKGGSKKITQEHAETVTQNSTSRRQRRGEALADTQWNIPKKLAQEVAVVPCKVFGYIRHSVQTHMKSINNPYNQSFDT